MLLETNRLILRKFKQEDFDDYCDYVMNDDELAHMIFTAPIHTLEEAHSCFDWKLNRETERWYALCLKEEGGKVIGGITIHPVPEEWADRPELTGSRGASLSFSISRHYRRRGLMEEAVRALIDHLFHTEGLDYINCGYMDYNLPSQKMQEKMGFTYLLTDTFEVEGTTYTAIESILKKS